MSREVARDIERLCTHWQSVRCRFGAGGSALNLNVHFHRLFLDGAYGFDRVRPRFHRAPRPTPAELVRLLHTISTRIAIGPNAGRKALTLRTVPAQPEPFALTLLASQPGFSLLNAICRNRNFGKNIFAKISIAVYSQSN